MLPFGPLLNHRISQALADQIPFANIQLEPQLIIALVQGKSPNDTKDLSTYPRQLGNLLAKCWSREPNQRPTATDCLHVVKSTLSGLETGGSPPSLPPHLSLAPSRMMPDRGPSIPNTRSTQSHNSNNHQQGPYTLSAENSPRNNALSNQRAANEARQTRQLGQNSVSLLVLSSYWCRLDCIGEQEDQSPRIVS